MGNFATNAGKAAALYAAVFIFMMFALSALVIYGRNVHRIGIGDGGNAAMARLIRVHGNYVEQLPATFALLILLPLLGASATLVHAVGGLVLVGRIAHAIGLSGNSGRSIGRLAGMILTYTGLLVGAGALITLAL